MAAMAEWFGGKIIDKIMDKLFDACFQYLQDLDIWKTGMKEAVERLQKRHPVIQSVVFAYNQAQIGYQNSALDRWLWQLRDAIDEADDLLDDFEYLRACKFRRVGEGAPKIGSNLKKLEEVVQKLDKVSSEVGTFLHLLESTKQEQQKQQLELFKARETGSLPKNDLIGRGQDKEFVMQWLSQPSNEERQTQINGNTLYNNISLLSIVGHGGMGKTTLLQHVYENEITNEFDLKMWVCVSNNFDAKIVIAGMLESLKRKRGMKSLDALQTRLKSAVNSKKFLLVLDDIWEEQEELDKIKWENVLAPLTYGKLGSKILITTRMDSVVSIIAKVIKKKKEAYKLGGLKEDECLQLLNSHAFANVENCIDHMNLRSIAGEIVKKLSGSPLAAKVIGGVLNSCLDERHWRRVLSSDIGSVELGQNDILPILRLSYIFLPKSIQNCFTFCSIFPQDHSFHKDDLVRMWVALGFIQQPSRGETVEDIGRRYFDVLLKKSFFEEFQDTYKLHNLLHELAQFVSAQECYRVVGDKELPILETIRHLSVKTNNLEVLKNLRKCKNLHSLFLSYEDNDQNLVDVLNEVFDATRSVRLLYIDAENLKLMPEKIGYLFHLRYLKLDHTSVTQLPRSLSNLYHLQFIIYNRIVGSLHPDFLPRDMNNLFNLHYLELPWHKFPGMHGIGKLNSLQELNGFYVKNEDGYRIDELEHMNELRQLSIYHLENVQDAEEACNAKLSDKWNLMELSLQWKRFNNITGPNIDVEVLDNLQPHKNLKTLKIVSYMGDRNAVWLNQANLISNLKYIKLHHCLEWQTLPPFGQLPFLKSLHLRHMPKVKLLDNKFPGNDKDCVFPSLEVLDINKLEALEDWFEATSAAGDCLFPCLTELYLKDCPNLKELLFLPPRLKKLEIRSIGWKAFNWLQVPSNCSSISIRDCSNIILLRGQHEVATAENCQLILTELTINDPSVLVALRSITSIQQLTIKDNDALDSFPTGVEDLFLRVSSSLCQLYFNRLKPLQSLPSFLNLSSLKFLGVENVPQLQQLPDIPASLKRLELKKLKSLQCLPSPLPISLCELHLAYLPNMECPSSCFTRLSFLQKLHIHKVPLLQELRDPPISLCELHLEDLDTLDHLPCLGGLSYLQKLQIRLVPQLRELPDLPVSLCELHLTHLNRLNCLPSYFLNLISLQKFKIEMVLQLQELPNLPSCLKELTISSCHPDLMTRYQKDVGSHWHTISNIPNVHINE